MIRFVRTLFCLLLFSVQCLALFSQNEGMKLARYTKVRTWTKAELAAVWKKNHVPQLTSPINYDVDVYEVEYCTSWINGSCITASGIYFVPTGAKKGLPLVCYNHGTQIQKSREIALKGEQAVCVGFATGGYLVAYVDYIGIGKGDGFHIYQHSESEAQASIDMLRAVKELNPEIGAEWNKMLFLTGYSQGGHAAMSLHKILQDRYKNEFSVTASSPMSGAYDMAGIQSEVMFHPYTHPGYLPYLMQGFQEAYHIMDGGFATAFLAPYDTLLPGLLDGRHSMGDINRVLPPIPGDAIRPEIVALFKNQPDFAFAKALRDNSVYDWTPERPVQICYCKADEQVNYKNALLAYNTMKKNGSSTVTLRHSGKRFGHNTCALFSALYTKMYFDSFLKGSKKGRKGPVIKRMLVSVVKLNFKK